MHFTNFLLPLAVSAAVLDTRQAGGKGKGGAPVAGIEKLQPVYRKTAQRTLTKYGPYTIKPGSTMMGQAFFLSIRDGLCNSISNGPCTVLAGRVGVMWADGKQADPSNGIYIHHILSSDNTKRETPWLSACNAPTRPGGSISALTGGTGFIGTGEDGSAEGALYTNKDGTQNSGYHIGAGDVFTAWAQLVNYNKDPAQVYIFYDTEWVPGNVGDNIKSMTVSATSCSGMIKMSPTGPTNTTSGKFTIMEDGRILGSRGHLHDGGVAMDLLINNKEVCSSKAEYGSRAEGHSHGDKGGAMMGGDAKGAKSSSSSNDASIKTISGMSRCQGPYPVKKGDTLTLVAEYDLQKHPLRKTATGQSAPDVMGMMGITFAQGAAKN